MATPHFPPKNERSRHKSAAKNWVLCGAIMAASIPASALAACTVKSESGQVIPYQEISLPSFEPATFDPQVAEGSILYEARGTSSSVGAMMGCNGVIGKMEYRGTGALGKFQTYATPVAGIGYRIRGAINPNYWWPQETSSESTFTNLVDGTGYFAIQLVKTGPITAPGTLTGEVGTTKLPEHGNQVVRRVVFRGSLPIRPTVPSCSVQKSVIGVPLGSISTHQLAQNGASDYKPFSIDLQCSGGTSGTSTRMFITLTDGVAPGNRGNVLSLSSSGPTAASGAGVEIRRADDSVVSFGPDSSAPGNPNQWFVGQYGNTNVSIPLKARYVKTGSPIKAGIADAAATFTMSYQ